MSNQDCSEPRGIWRRIPRTASKAVILTMTKYRQTMLVRVATTSLESAFGRAVCRWTRSTRKNLEWKVIVEWETWPYQLLQLDVPMLGNQPYLIDRWWADLNRRRCRGYYVPYLRNGWVGSIVPLVWLIRVIDDVDAPSWNKIKHQAEIAMEEVDVIVVVSGKEGT